MITKPYTYKNQEYTITIKQANVGSATPFVEPEWLITAVDKRNYQLVNLSIKNNILGYMLKTDGRSSEDFLTGLAQNEIEVQVGNGLHSQT